MKLIAIDLDGTLLSSDHMISEQNRQAILDAQAKGHIVLICSGRSPASINEVLQHAELSCPVAASNGTVMYTKTNTLKSISIEKKDVSRIINELEKEQLPYEIYTQNGVFIPGNWSDRIHAIIESGRIPADYAAHDLYEFTVKNPKEFQTGISVCHDPQVFCQRDDVHVQKFYVSTLIPQQKERLRETLHAIKGVGVTSSAQFNVEVMASDGHKGSGIRYMAEHFGISMENTVAIGDNFNDVPMFKEAGFAIAMGNAEPDVKVICDAVTKSNDENGVAHALNHLI